MPSDQLEELLLGTQTAPIVEYSPGILYPIPRSAARDDLALPAPERFHGADLWHAYEMSWLLPGGRPVSRVGRFIVPAQSPNIIESKSFKLYLNSLNGKEFADEAAAIEVMAADLSAIAGAPIGIELFPVDTPAIAGSALAGQCVDACELHAPLAQNGPDSSLLKFEAGAAVQQQLYSHLMRSLCPVTRQPDWATVWIDYHGSALAPESFLRYVLAFREHQEFHESCVERMFCDLLSSGQMQYLKVQAFYTRRGGLDINPMRCTDVAQQPLPRLNRQ